MNHRVILLISNDSGRWDYHRDLGPSNHSYPRFIPRIPLGHVVLINHTESNTKIIHLIASTGIRSPKTPHPVDYTALARALCKANQFLNEESRVVMPIRTCRLHGVNMDLMEKMLLHYVTNSVEWE